MESAANLAKGEDAFSLYLQARSEWNRRTPSSLRKAIRYLDRAISVSGTFPLACAALADCYSILMDYGVLSPREGLTQARLAAGRALHWGPNLAESLTSAALVRQMDLDWSTAEVEFNEAIKSHPGYPTARQRYGLFLGWMGRWEESRRELDAALTLDPHSPAIAASEAWIEYYQGHPREAIQASEKILDRYPGFSSAEAVLSLALVQSGRASEAAEVLEEARSGEEENVSLLSLLAYARGRNGDTKVAETYLGTLQDWAGTRYVSPYYLAVPLMGLGKESEVLEALEAAETERSPQVIYLATEPIFDPLRGRTAFRELLERLRLPLGPSEEPKVPEEVVA